MRVELDIRVEGVQKYTALATRSRSKKKKKKKKKEQKLERREMIDKRRKWFKDEDWSFTAFVKELISK
jgi:hypothetical protein